MCVITFIQQPPHLDLHSFCYLYIKQLKKFNWKKWDHTVALILYPDFLKIKCEHDCVSFNTLLQDQF